MKLIEEHDVLIEEIINKNAADIDTVKYISELSS